MQFGTSVNPWGTSTTTALSPNFNITSSTAATIGLNYLQSGSSTVSNGTATAFNIKCSKTGVETAQTIVATQNQDSSQRMDYTPTVSGLGTGSGTFLTGWNYYTLNGVNATVCIRFTKDASGGSGSTPVTFSLPVGITVDPTTRALGTLFTQNSITPAGLLMESGMLQFITSSGNIATGSNFVANGASFGCVTFPTTSKKPTNGAVIVNSVIVGPSVIDTADSASYASGTYAPT